MCHENKMGAAKEQHPYINQVDIVGGTGWNRGWNRVEQWNKWNSDPSPIHYIPHIHYNTATSYEIASY